MDVDALKQRAMHAIDQRAAALIELSHRIHEHPELAFHEDQASEWLVAERRLRFISEKFS